MLNQHLIAKTEPAALKENIILWDDIRVTVLCEGLFRVEKDKNKKFCDEATQSIWFRNTDAVEYSLKETGDSLIIKTNKATLTLRRDIMASTVRTDGKTVKLSSIKNLPGAYRSLDCCNGDEYSNNTETYKIKLEDGVVSSCGVGLHNDTESLILDENGRLCARDDDELDLYIFAHGKDYRGALKNLYTVSGKVPMIPKFALGNWWSRYHEYSDREYLHVIDKLADRDIPLTVATIDMDWHWSTTLDKVKKISESGKNDELHGGNNGWTGYSWNTDLFPDYKSFLSKIQDRNLKITLSLHPADGIRYFEDMYEDMAKAVGVDPETEQAIPFDFTRDDFINAYFDILHRPYERDGVDFWWVDWQQGTQTSMPGLDPLWALNHYHTLDNAKEHQPLILSRYCNIGSHRYPLGFSGDTVVTWRSLEYIPYFTAMGTNAGYTWWSHDIGGHMAGIKDDELYMRYVQFGTFSPINRLHCSACNTSTKEPMVYMNGKGLIAEEFLRLRHRMIPYLYSASYDTHNFGKALIEPMYYAYPEDKEAYKCKGQYLFGGDLIVAPITKKSDRFGMAAKKVWLPKGRWTDIFTGDEYDGGGWVEMIRWQDSFPVLASEGSFFVLDGRKHTNSIENSDILEVMAFNGNGSYTLHEDKDGRFMHTSFVSSLSDCAQTVKISTQGDKLMSKRTYKLQLRNIRKGTVSVYADGMPVACDVDDTGEYIEVLIKDAKLGKEYTVKTEFEDDRREYRNSRFFYTLLRIEAEAYPKEWLRCELNRLSDGDARSRIDKCNKYTELQRRRIKEAW